MQLLKFTIRAALYLTGLAITAVVFTGIGYYWRLAERDASFERCASDRAMAQAECDRLQERIEELTAALNSDGRK